MNNKLAFLQKVVGAENPADVLTEYSDKAMLTMALGKMCMRLMDGRSAVAPATVGTLAFPSHITLVVTLRSPI